MFTQAFLIPVVDIWSNFTFLKTLLFFIVSAGARMRQPLIPAPPGLFSRAYIYIGSVSQFGNYPVLMFLKSWVLHRDRLGDFCTFTDNPLPCLVLCF